VKGATKTLLVLVLPALLAISMVTPAMAQDQLNLGDGIVNSFFFGGGSNHISLTIPTMNCPGGTCVLGQGVASGTGNLNSSGSYSITSPAVTPVMGGFDGPFFLSVQADGSSVVTQTQPMTFSYTSGQGTLTGSLTLTAVSPSFLTMHGYWATATGTLSGIGGSFAQFFPTGGGSVTMSFGIVGLPLQTFPQTMHAFSPLQIENGQIIPTPAAGCGTLSRLQRYENHLPRIAPRGFDDLMVGFTQTNNPTQIPCSPSQSCGTLDVAEGSGGFAGDLVVTVQLSGVGTPFQFDRMGFNSDINSGFSLQCFAFDSNCTSGIGNARLGGSMQEDGFGRFAHTLTTGLSGGSGCSPDGTGCKNLFTFVIGNSNGALQVSDFDAYVAGHIANGACSGFIATPRDQ